MVQFPNVTCVFGMFDVTLSFTLSLKAEPGCDLVTDDIRYFLYTEHGESRYFIFTEVVLFSKVKLDNLLHALIVVIYLNCIFTRNVNCILYCFHQLPVYIVII